ncbi:hypothetical protein [Sorangium sp. So ce406]|uniref:hypothetical protein n=1 Tax=Sorangium sp. So ce406 TaxID=3133311 RepID=UPI003F5B543B
MLLAALRAAADGQIVGQAGLYNDWLLIEEAVWRESIIKDIAVRSKLLDGLRAREASGDAPPASMYWKS